jgi:DNA-binding GntR family transcriptional regulator
MEDYMDIIVKNTNFNQNKPIRQIVYEGLRKTIISSVIPVGERIIEKEYAEKLNISRTPVREALRMLELEELVEYVPKVGVVIKRISTEDVIEIFKIRYNLELLAVTEAMDNITQKEIREIEELTELTEQKNREGNAEEVMRLFVVFNSMIYEASRMKRLSGMISKLDEYWQRFKNISLSDPERRQQAIDEHKQILKAIAEKDKQIIEKIIKKHLEHSLDIVIKEIGEHENKEA